MSEWVSEWVSWANLSVDNEVTLTINHIRNHHYTVIRCIWELERKLGGLNVKGTHSHLCTLQQICSSFQSCLGGLHPHHIPQTTSDICWAAASCTQFRKLDPSPNSTLSMVACLSSQPFFTAKLLCQIERNSRNIRVAAQTIVNSKAHMIWHIILAHLQDEVNVVLYLSCSLLGAAYSNQRHKTLLSYIYFTKKQASYATKAFFCNLPLVPKVKKRGFSSLFL